MTLALLLLVAALIVFLVSTLQFKQPERLLIWAIGAGLLGWSVSLIVTAPWHYGIFRALADAWGGSAITNAFSRNAGAVAQFVPQLLDLFALATGILALVALIAFTPGKLIERLARPIMLILLGFMAGGVAALAVVAIGLGGQVRPRTYIGYVENGAVHDGDTFQLGEVSLRLWGLDAPELHQECRGVDHCGERAKAHLVRLVEGALVQCDQKESRRSRRLMESFGRPLVKCWVRRAGRQPFDLARRMIENGYGVQYRGESSHGYSAAETLGANRALMRGCWLRPDFWRNDNEARRAFEQERDMPEGAVLVGACAGPPPPEVQADLAGEADQDAAPVVTGP